MKTFQNNKNEVKHNFKLKQQPSKTLLIDTFFVNNESEQYFLEEKKKQY